MKENDNKKDDEKFTYRNGGRYPNRIDSRELFKFSEEELKNLKKKSNPELTQAFVDNLNKNVMEEESNYKPPSKELIDEIRNRRDPPRP